MKNSFLKRCVYIAWQACLKCYWRLSGGRHEKAMGLSLNLHPDTVWPGRRGLRLPREGCRSRIVAFADLVQAHAVCNFITSIPHSPIIIDVGAHHGEYALIIGGLVKAKAGMVIAVEPEPNNIKILKYNIDRNSLMDTVKVVECAISDVPGKQALIPGGSETKLFSSTFSGKEGGLISGPPCIEVRTLNDLINDFALERIDLLMIDVEGAELSVLRGFPWSRMRPSLILCELHPYNWKEFGYSGDDFTEFLQIHEYRCIDMYFKEHENFDTLDYIGPCLFLPTNRSSLVVSRLSKCSQF